MAAAAAAAVAGEAPMVEEAPPLGALYSFGRPWPELNEGLSYTDTFRCAGAGAATTLIEFYSVNYKSSAPVPGWIRRIRNGQIMVDGEVVTDPDMTPRDGSKLVYRRLPWQEPFAPYFLDVLYEDDDMVSLNKPSGLQVLPKGLFQQRTVLAQLQWKDWKMGSSCSSKRKEVQSHPVPVHRLGRGTSGILLCAKTKIAKVQLASYFAEGTINAGNKSATVGDIARHGRSDVSEVNSISTLLLGKKDAIDNAKKIDFNIPNLAKAAPEDKGVNVFIVPCKRKVCKNSPRKQIQEHTIDDPLYCNGGQPKFDRPESTATDGSFAFDGGYERPLQPVPGDCGYHLHAHWLVLRHPRTNKMVKITAPLPLILQTREERLATAKQTS